MEVKRRSVQAHQVGFDEMITLKNGKRVAANISSAHQSAIGGVIKSKFTQQAEEKKSYTTSAHAIHSGSNGQITKSKKKGKSNLVGKRKRQQNRIRKSEHQIQDLIVEFRHSQEWSKEKVTDLSQKTGLTESQVYKWNWDQRKKFIQDSDKVDAEVTRDEFGGYCCKRWGGVAGAKSEGASGDYSDSEDFDNNIWALIGCDIEKKAQEIVRQDFLLKRQKFSNLINTPLRQKLTFSQKSTQSAASQSSSLAECESAAKAKGDFMQLQTPKKNNRLQQKFDEIMNLQEQVEDLDEVKLCFMQDPTEATSKQTSINESGQTWLQSQKSPVHSSFEASAFNILSPWKGENSSNIQLLNHQQHLQNQNMQQSLQIGRGSSYSLRTPKMYRPSPMKSPFRPQAHPWIIGSPYVQEDREQYYPKESQFKSFHLLNFNQRVERVTSLNPLE